MTKLRAVVLLAVGILSVSRTRAQALNSSISLTICSHELSLGMSRVVALQLFRPSDQCTAFGAKNEPDVIAILKPDGSGPALGSLRFTNGRLTYITREWGNEIQTAEDFSRVFNNAFEQIVHSEAVECKVSVISQIDPNLEYRNTLFRCGPRSLVVSDQVHDGRRAFQITELVGK